MDKLIFSPFSPVFFALLGLTVLVGFILIRANKDKTEEKKRRAVGIFYGAILVIFIAYKISLIFDANYNVILKEAGIGGFSLWNELPLNLCNINMIFMILAMATNSKVFKSFAFYFGTLAAFMPLVMPSAGFECYSILEPRVLGYCITHCALLLCTPLLWGLKLFKPEFKDILLTLVTAILVMFFATAVSLAFRKFGLFSGTNYFFSVDPEGNPILELFHSWIPIPGVYLLPCTGIMVPYMLILTAIYRLCNKKKK